MKSSLVASEKRKPPILPHLTLWGAIAVLTGIFAAGIGWHMLYLLFAGILLAVFALTAFKAPRVASLVILAGVFVGGLYYHIYFNAQTDAGVGSGQVSIEGLVISDPGITKTGGEHFRIRLEGGRTARVVSYNPSSIRLGDTIVANGIVKERERIHEEPVIFANEVGRIETIYTSGVSLKKVYTTLSRFKYSFVDIFRELLPYREAALISGITLGVRSDFSPDFQEAMRKSGTTHIVALSGYNIAILVTAIFSLLVFFFRRRITFFITVSVIVLFVAMVGAEQSVVRAATMGILVLVAREIGRLYSFSHAVVFTALGMTLTNPRYLFEPGFQLSFISLLGLVYLSPAIHSAWSRFRKEGHPAFAEARRDVFKGSFLDIREHFTATLSAQLAVIPVIGFHFGTFSLVSFIANILILPFIPFTMFVGFLTAALGSIFSPFGYFGSWILRVLLGYEVGVIELFAKFPEMFTLGAFSISAVVCYYLVLFFVANRFKKI